MFHDVNVVRKEMRTTVPIDRVWDAWTDPDRLCQWFTDKVRGWPGVGSTLSLTWEKFGFTVDYKIAEMVPRKKLVLKTRLSGVGTQVLTVELGRRAPETILSLSESGPENHKSDPLESGVDSGWAMALGVLKLYLEQHYTEKRKSFLAMLPAQFTYDHLRAFTLTPEGQREWLAVSGHFPNQVGEKFELEMVGGQKMSGEVLVITHHEILVSWHEVNGYLEFKSFPLSGDQKGLCIRGAGYDISDERSDEIEELCKETLVRLFAALAGPAPTPAG